MEHNCWRRDGTGGGIGGEHDIGSVLAERFLEASEVIDNSDVC